MGDPHVCNWLEIEPLIHNEWEMMTESAEQTLEIIDLRQITLFQCFFFPITCALLRLRFFPPLLSENVRLCLLEEENVFKLEMATKSARRLELILLFRLQLWLVFFGQSVLLTKVLIWISYNCKKEQHLQRWADKVVFNAKIVL